MQAVMRLTVMVALVATACVRDLGTSAQRTVDTGHGSESGMLDLPLSFIENRGQVSNPNVAHYLQTPGAAVGFTSSGVRLGLADRRGTDQRWSLAMDFVGGRAQPQAQERLRGVVSYFKGDRADWRTGFPTHGRIVYRDLWPGIDLIYRADGKKLKYDLLVHPGADPNDIRLRWRGATSVELAADGSLRVRTPAGEVADQAPVSFQGAERVNTTFRLDGTTVGFRLGTYDRSALLTIDPTILVYAGYIGGAGADAAEGIAVDRSGAAYVSGRSASDATTFPEAVGPFLAKGTGTDAFVAKVSRDGGLVYAGYIGGDGEDYATAIAVDASGAAYVGGDTNSSSASFPDTLGAPFTSAGGRDMFFAKISANGMLASAGYLGGTANDYTRGLAVDAAGSTYIAGWTTSTNLPTVGPLGPTYHGGSRDGFVAKISGASLTYSAYIGGTGYEDATAVAVDPAGAAYVTGYTSSTSFPVLVGPSLVHGGGIEDAYVLKIDPAGSALVYSGYIGGNQPDYGYAVAVDDDGAAYVAGTTESGTNFPVKVGPSLAYGGGSYDGYIAKVDPQGTGLTYAGFIGGASRDNAYGVAVNDAGAAYVTGSTESGPGSFPDTLGAPFTYGGLYDAFAAKVSPGGTGFVYVGYLGGAGIDVGSGIALDRGGAAYIAGRTASDASTFPDTLGAPFSYGGGDDAFVAKITDNFCMGKVVTLAGTPGRDVLRGTTRADVILAGAGRDVIRGRGGADRICAQAGKDRVFGGGGKDRLNGGAGRDICDGGPKADRIRRCEVVSQD